MASIENDQFRADFDPFEVPREVQDLFTLYRNMLALMVNNARSGIYIVHFIKRLMRSKVPCITLQKMRDMVCSKGFDMQELNNFIPLDELADVLQSAPWTGAAEDLKLASTSPISALWKQQLQLTGGHYKVKKRLNIHTLHKDMKHILKLYNKIFSPLHNVIQSGGRQYDEIVEMFDVVLKDFTFDKAKKFMKHSPKIGKKILKLPVWDSITNPDNGVLKDKLHELQGLLNEIKLGPNTRDKPSVDMGRREWSAWKEISDKNLTKDEAKKEYVKIITDAINEVYNKYKLLDDKDKKLTASQLKKQKDLEESCAKISLPEKADAAEKVQKEYECNSIKGCQWQTTLPQGDMVCKPGNKPGVIRSVLPEGVTEKCGVVDGPCNLLKGLAHFICPTNKFNILLVEKFESVFSDNNINKMLGMMANVAAEIFGKDGSLPLSIDQIQRDIWRINKELRQADVSGQKGALADMYASAADETDLANTKLKDEINAEGGGRAIYKYIVNPQTNRKVRINTKLGQTILKKYSLYQNK
jgi:acyl-CoA-binding protein